MAVVDDVEASRNFIATLLTREGYAVFTAGDGAAGLALVRRQRPDVVISDVMMPRIDGFELCQRLKSDRETRLTPVVLVTGAGDREHRLKGIEAGADDFLSKPVDRGELKARVQSLVRLKRFTDDLDSADSVILSLGVTVEARDGCTRGHCERMAAFMAAFGAELGLPAEDIAALHRGGFLHDVGKIGVPDAILRKTGPLSADERAVMQRHPVIGESVCGDLRLLRPVKPIVRHHHERLDGSGYPDGLRGDAIPLLAQIAGIADVYDALTSDRPYRAALPPETAFAELRHEVAQGWRSAALVEQFIALAVRGRLLQPSCTTDRSSSSSMTTPTSATSSGGSSAPSDSR